MHCASRVGVPEGDVESNGYLRGHGRFLTKELSFVVLSRKLARGFLVLRKHTFISGVSQPCALGCPPGKCVEMWSCSLIFELGLSQHTACELTDFEIKIRIKIKSLPLGHMFKRYSVITLNKVDNDAHTNFSSEYAKTKEKTQRNIVHVSD